jgi:hypothetical protein
MRHNCLIALLHIHTKRSTHVCVVFTATDPLSVISQPTLHSAPNYVPSQNQYSNLGSDERIWRYMIFLRNTYGEGRSHLVLCDVTLGGFMMSGPIRKHCGGHLTDWTMLHVTLNLRRSYSDGKALLGLLEEASEARSPEERGKEQVSSKKCCGTQTELRYVMRQSYTGPSRPVR